MGFLPLLLVLLSGDVETNPGPLAPLARGPNLEKVYKVSEWQTDKMDVTHTGIPLIFYIGKAVVDLKRELKEVVRTVERQEQQISS